jgi:hypothetical protein
MMSGRERGLLSQAFYRMKVASGPIAWYRQSRFLCRTQVRSDTPTIPLSGWPGNCRRGYLLVVHEDSIPTILQSGTWRGVA